MTTNTVPKINPECVIDIPYELCFKIGTEQEINGITYIGSYESEFETPDQAEAFLEKYKDQLHESAHVVCCTSFK